MNRFFRFGLNSSVKCWEIGKDNSILMSESTLDISGIVNSVALSLLLEIQDRISKAEKYSEVYAIVHKTASKIVHMFVESLLSKSLASQKLPSPENLAEKISAKIIRHLHRIAHVTHSVDIHDDVTSAISEMLATLSELQNLREGK